MVDWAVELPLDQLHRLAGPAGHPVLCPVDDEYWDDRVEAMDKLAEDGWSRLQSSWLTAMASSSLKTGIIELRASVRLVARRPGPSLDSSNERTGTASFPGGKVRLATAILRIHSQDTQQCTESIAASASAHSKTVSNVGSF